MLANKRSKIFRNTIFLYIRMFVLMIISMYTSRLILQILGVEDFGIYNVLGNCVVMFAFVNNAMTTSTLRFFSFEIGKPNGNISSCFVSSLRIYVILAILFIVISEIATYFILNNIMSIPASRMHAAIWVLQFSIFTTAMSFLLTPYNALIVAYEKMSFYAYAGIITAVMKLGIVYLLYLTTFDRLISYSALLFGVSIITQIMYMYYCHIVFSEVNTNAPSNKSMIKSMLSFSGWSLLGGFANVMNNQFIGVIFNKFCGVLVNAALAVANQISSVAFLFVSNFQLAFKPSLIKFYASNRNNDFIDLIFFATKISFVLVWIISIPLLNHTDFILKIWLVDVPDLSVEFTKLTIYFAIVDAICGPMWLSIQATGNIKIYQIIVSLIILLNVPLAILCLQYGFSTISVLEIRVLINIILWFWRIYYLNKRIDLPAKKYIKDIAIPIIAIVFLSHCLPMLFYGEFTTNSLTTTALSELVSILMVYLLLFNKSERSKLIEILMSKFAKS